MPWSSRGTVEPMAANGRKDSWVIRVKGTIPDDLRRVYTRLLDVN